MSAKAKVFWVLAVIIILALGAYILFGGKNENKPTNNPVVTVTVSPTPSIKPTTSPITSLTINYTDTGFSPDSSTVSKGSTIIFTNNTTESVQIYSDPHPQHSNSTELNIGQLDPGDSRQIIINSVGVTSFHNDFNLSQTAIITIQ
jgi:plastocyanin